LRESLNWLRDELTRIYESEASKILIDPWKAREDYINVILNRNDDTIKAFLKRHCKVDVEQNRVFRLMEVQRNAMLMFTSCGWFFDEISGIETVQILQYACRAMQLVSQTSDVNLEEEFLARPTCTQQRSKSFRWGRVCQRYVVPSNAWNALCSGINLRRRSESFRYSLYE
jgi:alpha-amylase/alpha-mannosidase (GH57 family)